MICGVYKLERSQKKARTKKSSKETIFICYNFSSKDFRFKTKFNENNLKYKQFVILNGDLKYIKKENNKKNHILIFSCSINYAQGRWGKRVIINYKQTYFSNLLGLLVGEWAIETIYAIYPLYSYIHNV